MSEDLSLEPEVLVTLQLVFPALDSAALGELLAPTVTAALGAGGRRTNLSIQPYDSEGEE